MLFVIAANPTLAQKPHLSPSDIRQHRLFIPRPTQTESRWFMRAVFGRRRPHLEASSRRRAKDQHEPRAHRLMGVRDAHRNMPPETSMRWPVTQRPAGEQSMATTPPTS